MTGWRTQIDMGQPYEPVKGVIGVVVAQKFPEPETIRLKLEEGIERVSPDTVWVMREAEREGHAVRFAWQTFRSHGIEPILAPLVPYWKTPKRTIRVERDVSHVDECEQDTLQFIEHLAAGRDDRAGWRDSEMRSTTERIIVFHDKSSNITAEWVAYKTNHLSRAKIYVIERGKKKPVARRGRKPIGA